MFYRYEIIRKNGEDILYLYLDMKYEFSSDEINENSLTKLAYDYIDMNNINFKGKKIFLIINGIVVKSFDINNLNKLYDKNKYYSINNYMINISDNSKIYSITLKDYLLGILFPFCDGNNHDEVIKAICVLFITYAYKMMKDYNKIFNKNQFAIYKDVKNYKNSDNYFNIISKLNTLINDVDCNYLSYNTIDNYILPFFHYCNSGRTMTNSNYPYLSSVKSTWDITSTKYLNIKTYSYFEFGKKLNLEIKDNQDIKLTIKNNKLFFIINGNLFTLEEIKNIFKLKSNNLTFILYKDYLKIIGKGIGNSYGLSIFGANELAKNGATYSNILKYYFPKVKLYKYVKIKNL